MMASRTSGTWDDLKSEIERCRRTRSSFVLIRVLPPKLSLAGAGVARRSRAGPGPTTSFLSAAAPIRTVDKWWRNGTEAYFLLVDTDLRGAERFLARLREKDSESSVDLHVRIAEFPRDGLTYAAVLAALESSEADAVSGSAS